MRTKKVTIERNLPPTPLSVWRRLFVFFLYTVSFTILGGVSLLWALGYQINPVTFALQQTGIIQLSSPQVGINPDIYVNGVKQGAGLPFRKGLLLPADYDITVKKDGYQTWEKTVSVGANQYREITDIILLYETPKPVTVSNISSQDIVKRNKDSAGIVIKNDNELWVNGQFITRRSADIVQAEWYADHQHILYQVGPELDLINLQSRTTALVKTLQTTTPISYMFQDNGRVLITADGTTVEAVELYQSYSLLDRIIGTH